MLAGVAHEFARSCPLRTRSFSLTMMLWLCRTCLATGEDWRHIEGKLPFDEAFLHHKPIGPRSNMKVIGGTLGIPMQFGWEASRLAEKKSQVQYTQQSTGMFCANNGHPFIFEGTDDPNDCVQKCTDIARCTHVTAYLSSGWCQIAIRCAEEAEAGDASSITLAKTLSSASCSHSPKAECFGGWVAELGKPIKPRGGNFPT
mmetsp:Transcript_48996/g.79516  ORF Transcript_48996/g.79516 Transcript_48996/m.79516 type:complete len:201 (-) Transcript_48996:136-738(-)